jgi:hypothetical protein
MASKEDHCRHCGGKLEWLALPHVVWAEGRKPADAPPTEVSTLRICNQCGRVEHPETTRRLPLLGDLQRETEERRMRGQ